MSTNNKSFTIHDLKWDTEFFGVSCAKVVMNHTLSEFEWEELRNLWIPYQFVSITNINSNMKNSQVIKSGTKAELMDINVQFIKKPAYRVMTNNSVEIYHAYPGNDQILSIAKFPFSKFIKDPEFAKRGGDKVYDQWLLNSFGKAGKYFALCEDESGNVKGFLLYSYSEKSCIIELIAAERSHSGIGTKLFQTVENEVYRRGCTEIKVGTQYENINAMKFYRKMGCNLLGEHQVYHLWNI